ncbi:MAG: carboxymuconolactone decarboxylase family protein [Burkholderiales bacterium]
MPVWGSARGVGSSDGGVPVKVRELYERGLNLRRQIFGEQKIDQIMNELGEFGEPLQHIINTYAYGDVWKRGALPPRTKSLAVIALTAAIDRPDELRVHVQGALRNGCTPEEIREILLLVAVYCGIPAANAAHRIAYEAISAHQLRA